MKRLYLLVIFFPLLSLGQVPSLDWVQTFGNDGTNQHDEFHDMAVDSEGNIYVTATIVNYNTTTPWPAPSNGSIDIIVMKLDADGNTIWVKQIGGPNADGGHSFPGYGVIRTWISLVKDQYLIVGGIAGTNCDLDPGIGTLLTDNGSNDIHYRFVVRLDLDGEFVWGKVGEPSDVYSDNYMATDTSGGIYYLAGTEWTDSTDVHPSPTEEIWITPDDYAGNWTDYIVKLDSIGEFDWFGILPTSDNTGTLNPLPSGSGQTYSPLIPFKGGVLTSQTFNGLKKIALPNDTIELTSNSWAEPYIVAIGPDGGLDWYGQFEGDSMQCSLMSMTVDESDNIYISGISLIPATDIDIDPGEFINQQNLNGTFFMKLDREGNLVWFTSIGGDKVLIDDLDINGDALIGVGSFLSEITVQTNAGELTFNATDRNAFIIQLDTSGTVHWAGSFEGTGSVYHYIWMRVMSHVDNGFLVGSRTHFGQMDLDPGLTQSIYNYTDGYDFFVERLEFPPVSIHEPNSINQQIGVFPNPSRDVFRIMTTANDPMEVTVFNAVGQVVYMQANVTTNSVIDLSGLSNGLYSVRFFNDELNELRQVVVQK